jgi:hypothetical protein
MKSANVLSIVSKIVPYFFCRYSSVSCCAAVCRPAERERDGWPSLRVVYEPPRLS